MGGQAAGMGKALAVPAVCSGGCRGRFSSSGSQGDGLERIQDSRKIADVHISLPSNSTSRWRPQKSAHLYAQGVIAALCVIAKH